MVGRVGEEEVERLVRGGAGRAYHLERGREEEGMVEGKGGGKKEGMVYWRCCVMERGECW